MNPFRVLLSVFVKHNRPTKPTNTGRLAVEHLDERWLPSVSAMSMASPHVINQMQVHVSAVSAPETSNPNAIGVGHHWEVADAHALVSEGFKPESTILLARTYTVRFFE